MSDLPKRKPNRIESYDYSAPGAYFITVCTAGREKLFWSAVDGVNGRGFSETMGFPADRPPHPAEILL